MTNDPDVLSVERDCYIQLNASSLPKLPKLPKGVVRDASPDLHKVARRLSVQKDAPWGIDRIDTAGEPTVMSWRQQHHNRSYSSGLSHSCPRMQQRASATYDGAPIVLPSLLPSFLAPAQAARSTAAMTTAT
jgi:hypothetical protein|tara:strand:+ start:142 stop:537 length:396 start_codon:yes stop_codon:yes gene_type:complete